MSAPGRADTAAGRVLAALAVGLGAWLRFRDLGVDPLRNDEIFVISRAGGSVAEVLARVQEGVMAAPLEFLMRNLVLRFSDGEFWLRFPDALLGTLAILLVYRLGARLFGPLTGGVAALLLAGSTLAVHYAQDARFYSLFLVTATWSSLALLRARRSGRGRDWALYAVSLVVGFYTAYFTALVVLVHAVFHLADLARRGAAGSDPKPAVRAQLLGFLLAGAAVALAFLPWLLVYQVHPRVAYPRIPAATSAGRLVGDFLNAHTVATWVEPRLLLKRAATWVHSLLLLVGVVSGWRERRASTVLCLLFALLPPPLVLWIDNRAEYFFEPRQLIFALPFVLVLVAQGLVAGSRQLAFRLAGARAAGVGLAFVAAGLACLAVLAAQTLSSSRHRPQEDWRAAARYVAERLEPGDVLVTSFYPVGPPDGDQLRFYLRRLGVADDRYTVVVPSQLEAAQVSALAAQRGLWFVTAEPRFYQDQYPQLLETLRGQLEAAAEFPGAAPWLSIEVLHSSPSRAPAVDAAPQSVMMGSFQRGEAMRVLPARAGAPVRIPVSGRGSLRLALGVQAEPAAGEAFARFRVSLVGAPRPLLEQTLAVPAGARETGWHPLTLPVEPGDAPGELLLTAETGASGDAGGVRAWWGAPHFVPADAPRRTPVVLIAVDTLRADHLSLYGYPRRTSPHLEALARDGIVFENAIAQAPWTLPSFASVLTSSFSPDHRAGRRDLLRPEVTGIDFEHVHPFEPRTPTLPELLEQAGYRNLLLSGNVFLTPLMGFSRFFHRSEWWVYPDWRGDAVADEAIAWLSQYADEPFAMLLDFMDPHVPHTLWGEEERPPPERLGRQALVDTYDDDVAFTDDQLGRVLDALRRLGLYDRALIVFFSDHGEELRERGHLGHGHSRFEEIIRVPLVVKLPGSRLAGRRVDAVVRNLDIAPTVLAVLGLEAPRSFRGENLLALLDASQAAHGRVALTESEHTFSPNEKISARDRTHKLVYDVQTGEERLYDLEKDPGETRDVSERERERVAALRPSVYALFLEKFPGLHLACRSSRPVTVKGRVAFREPVVRRVKRVFFEEDDRTVVRDQRVVDFRFDLSDGFDALLLDGPGAGAGARVGLRARGRRVPARRVALGESGDAPASVPWEIGDLRDLAITRYDEAAHRALASEEGLRCFFWATRLEDAGAETPQPDAAEPLDAELREQLRILGYGE